VTDPLTRAFADVWGRIVATLVRVTGDWALAEDAVQDAFAAAAVTWRRDGVPRSPGAWLTTVARNRALDRLRRASTERTALEATVALQALTEGVDVEPDDVPDDRLRLIFTCCHPALPLESRVALTLRTLCGLTVEEIAHAFGVGEPAMAKRLVRARQKIQRAGIPYRVPSGAALPERLAGVLAVLYLLFSEGYAPSGGTDVVRPPLSAEAIRLTRVLAALLPGEPEVLGLLALELFQDSRRTARTSPEGALVPLDEQDRSLWNADRIAEGERSLAAAERIPAPTGQYLLQARIAAEHARGDRADRRVIVTAYGELAALTPSPFVALARAIAIAGAEGPEAGLAELRELRAGGALQGDHYLPAAEADLLRRQGRREQAAAAYREALALVRNDAERAYLQRRLAEVTAPAP
jgi:RNA polymerase sigma-70 factor (ECF subfamily)